MIVALFIVIFAVTVFAVIKGNSKSVKEQNAILNQKRALQARIDLLMEDAVQEYYNPRAAKKRAEKHDGISGPSEEL